MSKSTTTLKQIAETAGVSITTVHRVMNGKEGCGEELRRRIMEIAKQQGYEANYVASSLRKKPVHIALIFPKGDADSHFYVQEILNGYFQEREEIEHYNIIFQEYYYPAYDMGSTAFLNFLNNIYQEKPFHYDGMVIYKEDLGEERRYTALLNRILGKRIPVIVLEKCASETPYSCLVGPDEALAGKMAAEMMAKMVCQGGNIKVFGQELPFEDRNAAAFSEELKRRRSDLSCEVVALKLNEEQSERIQRELTGKNAFEGIYFTCARHTAAFLRTDLSCRQGIGAVIGSELFEESYQALQTDTLDAVIDKKPFSVGYKALNLLFNNIVKNEKMPVRQSIIPRIIIQSNSYVYYRRRKENYGGSKDFEYTIY